MENYVGDEKDQQQGNQREGLNQMDKTLVVEGARISYCIWEVQGIYREREDPNIFLLKTKL